MSKFYSVYLTNNLKVSIYTALFDVCLEILIDVMDTKEDFKILSCTYIVPSLIRTKSLLVICKNKFPAIFRPHYVSRYWLVTMAFRMDIMRTCLYLTSLEENQLGSYLKTDSR